jgi:alkyl hydroperoxide reductase subunit AhpC
MTQLLWIAMLDCLTLMCYTEIATTKSEAEKYHQVQLENAKVLSTHTDPEFSSKGKADATAKI